MSQADTRRSDTRRSSYINEPANRNDSDCRLILNIIQSEDTFRQAYLEILGNISKKNKIYNQKVVPLLTQIITDNFSPPIVIFNAAYLLVRASESKHDVIIDRIAVNQNAILDHFTQAAIFDNMRPPNEKGKTYFSKHGNTEDQRLGKQFVHLCGEALTFWGEEYGDADTDSPYNLFYEKYAEIKRNGIDFQKYTFLKTVYPQNSKKTGASLQLKSTRQADSSKNSSPNIVDLRSVSLNGTKRLVSENGLESERITKEKFLLDPSRALQIDTTEDHNEAQSSEKSDSQNDADEKRFIANSSTNKAKAEHILVTPAFKMSARSEDTKPQQTSFNNPLMADGMYSDPRGSTYQLYQRPAITPDNDNNYQGGRTNFNALLKTTEKQKVPLLNIQNSQSINDHSFTIKKTKNFIPLLPPQDEVNDYVQSYSNPKESIGSRPYDRLFDKERSPVRDFPNVLKSEQDDAKLLDSEDSHYSYYSGKVPFVQKSSGEQVENFERKSQEQLYSEKMMITNSRKMERSSDSAPFRMKTRSVSPIKELYEIQSGILKSFQNSGKKAPIQNIMQSFVWSCLEEIDQEHIGLEAHARPTGFSGYKACDESFYVEPLEVYSRHQTITYSPNKRVQSSFAETSPPSSYRPQYPPRTTSLVPKNGEYHHKSIPSIGPHVKSRINTIIMD